MNDAEYEAQKARVLAVFAEWSQRLALSHWDFYYTWHRQNPKDHGEGVIMSVGPEWQYLHANVQVYLEETAKRDDEFLRRDVVHELAHCLLAPACEGHKIPSHLVEFTASSLTRLILVLTNAEEGVGKIELLHPDGTRLADKGTEAAVKQGDA